MARRWLLATSLVVLVAAPSMPAQAPLAFDVASVKPSPFPNAIGDLFIPPDSPVLITNYTLGGLITYAYGLKSRHELTGGPDWLLKEKFVIRAVPPRGTTTEQVPRMVQNLLAERFKLRLRKEEGALPVWALVLDRGNTSLGPQLTPSKYACKAFIASGNASAPDAPRDDEGQPACRASLSVNSMFGVALEMTGVPVDELARRLDTPSLTGLDAPIVDGTGLTGNYDIRVAFAGPAWALKNIPQTTPPVDVAVREQLGLKLERRTAPGMRYVVESVERPMVD